MTQTQELHCAPGWGPKSAGLGQPFSSPPQPSPGLLSSVPETPGLPTTSFSTPIPSWAHGLFMFQSRGFRVQSCFASNPLCRVSQSPSFLIQWVSVCPSVQWDSASESPPAPTMPLVGSIPAGLCVLRQQTWGNRLYFSSFPVPVLEDPTYVGPEDIPRVLGAEGAAASARKIPSWRWGALPREGTGLDCLPPLHFHGVGLEVASASGCGCGWRILPAPLPLTWR